MTSDTITRQEYFDQLVDVLKASPDNKKTVGELQLMVRQHTGETLSEEEIFDELTARRKIGKDDFTQSETFHLDGKPITPDIADRLSEQLRPHLPVEWLSDEELVTALAAEIRKQLQQNNGQWQFPFGIHNKFGSKGRKTLPHSVADFRREWESVIKKFMAANNVGIQQYISYGPYVAMRT